MDDTIYRQAALDALSYCQTYLFDSRDDDKKISLEDAEYAIEQLPSAQPEERTDKRTETHTCDLIDRRTLDLAFTKLRFNKDGTLRHWGDRPEWCLYGQEVEELINSVPPVDAAQVVRCKDCKFSDWYTAVNGGQFCYCSKHDSSGHQEDDYCSYGEKDGDGNG